MAGYSREEKACAGLGIAVGAAGIATANGLTAKNGIGNGRGGLSQKDLRDDRGGNSGARSVGDSMRSDICRI